jgi:hypothetical protein
MRRTRPTIFHHSKPLIIPITKIEHDILLNGDQNPCETELKGIIPKEESRRIFDDLFTFGKVEIRVPINLNKDVSNEKK